MCVFMVNLLVFQSLSYRLSCDYRAKRIDLKTGDCDRMLDKMAPKESEVYQIGVKVTQY